KKQRILDLEWNIPKNVRFVSVDFNIEKMTDKLLSVGFDTSVKTFFTILGVSYYLTLPVVTETLRQIADLSALGSELVFDFPLYGTDFPQRVSHLEHITEELGEKMSGGFTYSDVSRALYSLGFQIDTYLPPVKVEKSYFGDRSDELHAFENVSLLSARYTSGYVFE
ncbi:MAG: class I SAM-dependent methyltransferase, partial [Oscillospiraceae bacterium]|nr:class I SAM-dependent methyltransferase [Oscillospiraceae bacterium]